MKSYVAEGKVKKAVQENKVENRNEFIPGETREKTRIYKEESKTEQKLNKKE
jgi:hypothetical protein